MMQNQSSKARKGQILNDFPTFISKPQDKKDPNNSEITKTSKMDSVLSDFPLCAPSCEMDLDEEEDTIPWMNFPIVEPFNDECSSGFLPELGVAGNETSLVSMERRSNSHHVNELAQPSSAANAPSIQQDSISKVLSSVTELNKLKIGDKSPIVQSQHPLSRPGNSEFTHSDASNGNRMDVRHSVGSSWGSKLHKLDAGQPSSSSGLMNFPYLSRLASLSGVNVRNTATTTGAVICGKQRACDKNSGGLIRSLNPMEPSHVDSSHQETVSHVKLSMPPTAGSVESVNSEPDSFPLQQAEALPAKAGNNEKSLDTAPTTIMVRDERIPKPVVATSSLCSGNRLESASNDPAYSLKRMFHETGDSEDPSDEAEEESIGDRKIISGHTGFKRGRAAQVHNLSERRRRERINEKMRALQELIPSGNKADKASMLDEAIEYLRTLQLQVQILSMGTGMYMPPMMLPAAMQMQQMHHAHMPQFSPMGIGMGMHDVNYSMTSMPNIQAPCYPVPGPPFPTTSAFPGAVGYTHQFLGHPGQELLMSMPSVPPPQSPLFGSPTMRLPVGNVTSMLGTVDLPLCASSAGSKEMIQNVSSQKIHKGQAKSSMFDDSDQPTGLLNDQYQDDDAAQSHGSTKRRRLASE